MTREGALPFAHELLRQRGTPPKRLAMSKCNGLSALPNQSSHATSSATRSAPTTRRPPGPVWLSPWPKPSIRVPTPPSRYMTHFWNPATRTWHAISRRRHGIRKAAGSWIFYSDAPDVCCQYMSSWNVGLSIFALALPPYALMCSLLEAASLGMISQRFKDACHSCSSSGSVFLVRALNSSSLYSPSRMAWLSLRTMPLSYFSVKKARKAALTR
jgi:hypothetical protein